MTSPGRMRRISRVAACVLALCCAAGPVAADWDCATSRCAEFRIIPPPKAHHYRHHKQAACCEAPPGWGWYRRQKFNHDNEPPLVVFDELGGNVSINQNW
jgi:hypothetical protein